jgi:Ca2+-binding RTX toxin-like protein
MASLTLNTDYGYKEYWLKNAPGTVITATTAEWDIAGNETVPAINIYDSDNVIFDGGEIWGHCSQTAEWSSIYNHMATGFRVSDSANVTIRNVKIDGTWDGIRFIPDDSLNVSNGSSNGWLVEDVYMHNIRDDAIENDFAATGTVRDTLFDGVFSAFGTVNDQSAHGTLTVDDSIIIMKSYLKDGEMTHGSPFKFNTADPGNNPDLKIVNTIIAIEDVTHNGFSRLNEAWDNLTQSSGNYYLNLSDTPFPSNYPLPPFGFTILQGQAARDFLAQQKAKWLAEHDGPQSPTDPDPTDPTPAPTPDPTPAPEPSPVPGGSVIKGTSGNDTLKGTANAERIEGGAGSDLIYGMGGSDALLGGTGSDKFVLNTKLGGSVAQILDFNPAEDAFYLDTAIFTKLVKGTLSSPTKIYGTNLEDGAGAKANDNNDFLIYDKTTGNLSYDADGNGSGASVVIAKLQPGLDLTAGNFYTVSGTTSGGAQSPSTSEPGLTPIPEPTPDPTPTPPASGSISGTSGSDTLFGTAGIDKIVAQGGADYLYGKGGADQLTGGAGEDKFVFDTKFDGTIDEIMDFNPLEDVLYLDDAIFTKLSGGSLSDPQRIYSGQLKDGAGAKAGDSSDFLIYDSNTGNLSYDADGSGAGAGIVFAHLQPGLDLVPADFYVI